MRILGLDVGEKTIGVALSDELGVTAQGLRTIRRRGPASDLRALEEVVREYGVERIVVGLPRNMDGSMGPAARKVLAFAERLAVFELPVETQDERLTTVQAERLLIQADVRRAERRRVIDKVAAALMLQAYLDRRGLERGRGG